MIQQITKEKLLETGYVVDNNYLDKYVDLINDHLTDIKVECKTHSHHIIPVSYYRRKNIDVDNSISNRVNLTYKNHMLAHLYLSGCTEGRNKYLNLYSVFQLSHFDKEGYLDITNYDKYQQLHDEAISAAPNHRKGTKCSPETIQRMRNAQQLRMKIHGPVQTGRIRVHNEVKETVIDKDKLESYLASGYAVGRKYKHTAEDIAKQTAKTRGQKRSAEFCKAISDRMHKYYETHEGAFKGKQFTQEQLDKISKQSKGRITINNGLIYKRVHPEELDLYLADGWTFGTGVKRTLSPELRAKRKGRKYIHKNGSVKAVRYNDLQTYLDDGWIMGRK